MLLCNHGDLIQDDIRTRLELAEIAQQTQGSLHHPRHALTVVVVFVAIVVVLATSEKKKEGRKAWINWSEKLLVMVL